MSEGIENRSVRRARKKETKEIDIWLLRELQRYCYSLPVLEFCFFRGVAPHIPSVSCPGVEILSYSEYPWDTRAPRVADWR